MNAATRAGGPVARAILEEAAGWYAALRADTVDAATRDGWRRWLAQGPAQQRAWEEVEAISRQFQAVPAPQARDVLQASARRRRRMLSALPLAAGALSAGWLLSRAAPLAHWTAAHRTQVGETRLLALPDGTRLWLDTHSAVDVDYQAGLRLVHLHAGAVLALTAPDTHRPARPFVIRTPHADLRAIGTRFSARLEPDHTLLALYEGAVAIRPLRGEERIIEAARQTRIDASHIGPLQPANPAYASWSAGILQAENMRLDTFVAELSRYRRGLITCDAAIGHLRLVGAYPLADIDQALDILADTLPVRVRRILPGWTAIEPAGT